MSEHHHAGKRFLDEPADAGAGAARDERDGVPGRRTLVEAVYGRYPAGAETPLVQHKLTAVGQAPRDTTQVQEAARHGVSGAPSALPFRDRIQSLFGRHDISQIQAHTDAAAGAGATAMGARAFASGTRVAFAGPPDLHTAAHEAAHVIQQRGGVQLKGGVGEAGDVHERHADAVADRVVLGESAEALLDDYAPAPRADRSARGAATTAPIQRKPVAGNQTTAGQEYTDDRGGPIMHGVQGYPDYYTVNGITVYYFAQTDQYMKYTGTETSDPSETRYWDPVTAKELSHTGIAYSDGEHLYDYDGKNYIAHTQDGAQSETEGRKDEVSDSEGLGETLGETTEKPTQTIETSTKTSGAKPIEIDIDMIDVPVVSGPELRSSGITSMEMARRMIRITAEGHDWQQAWSLLKSWNAHYAQFKVAESSTPPESSKKTQTKKRKKIDESPPRKLKAEECGLQHEHIAYLKKDQVREKESSQDKRRKKVLETLTVNDREYALAPLSTDGGFYDVYTIVDDKPIMTAAPNSDLVLRIPKEGADPGRAKHGLLDHRKISDHITVPKIYNDPRKDGFFLVEKIAMGCNPKPWREASSLTSLPEVDRKRLAEIRRTLVQNAKSGRQVVPDFRPSNLRFHAVDSPVVVLVDFTDEAGLSDEHAPDEFAREMKHLLREFCGTEKNWLYTYLTEGMPSKLLSDIERVELF